MTIFNYKYQNKITIFVKSIFIVDMTTCSIDIIIHPTNITHLHKIIQGILSIYTNPVDGKLKPFYYIMWSFDMQNNKLNVYKLLSKLLDYLIYPFYRQY